MIRAERTAIDQFLLAERPLRWDVILQQLSLINPPVHLDTLPNNTLSVLRRGIESDGATLHDLQQLSSIYPMEFAFSILLCTLRFPGTYSMELMDTIVVAIKHFKSYIMDYCIEKFNGGRNLEKTDDNIIGEALTLLFSFFDDYVASAESGNLDSIKYIRRHYPDSILYSDAHSFNALHGVCGALNKPIMKYLIMWHLERKPDGRGGLYEMNDSGITALDTLLDTQQDITTTLTWLRTHGLLTSLDVERWLLVHRAGHSSSINTIRFLLDLFPSGTSQKDDDGNLPIHLHIALRYRGANTFSDNDFDILRLLIVHSITYGEIDSIGGLFHQDPEEDRSCTLAMLLEEAGEENTEKVWQAISQCLEEVGEYSDAPIVHAAILNRNHVPRKLFREILVRFGANSRNEHGELPLTYSARNGMEWDKGFADILEANRDAMNEVDIETNLPFAIFAASTKADLSSIYHLALKNLHLFTSQQ